MHDLGDRFEPCGGGDPHRHARLRAAEQQRVGHVVAVAQVGEAAALERSEPLAHRQQIGQRLAGMLEVGQRVHDRHVGRPRERLEPLLLERPQHDRVDVAGQHPAGVLDRLASPQLEVARGQDDRMCPQLRHGHLERDAGARARLLEDQRDRSTGEPALVRLGSSLHVGGEIEQLAELFRAQIVDGEVVALHGAESIGNDPRGASEARRPRSARPELGVELRLEPAARWPRPPARSPRW